MITFVDARTGGPADLSPYGLFQPGGGVVPASIRAVDPATGAPLAGMAGYGMTNEEWEKMGAAWALPVTVGVVVGGTAIVLALQERDRIQRARAHAHARARAAAAAALPQTPATLPGFPEGEPQTAAALVGPTAPWIHGPLQSVLLAGGTLLATWGVVQQRWGWAAAGLASTIVGKGIGA